jgi:hypothetical protein
VTKSAPLDIIFERAKNQEWSALADLHLRNSSQPLAATPVESPNMNRVDAP